MDAAFKALRQHGVSIETQTEIAEGIKHGDLVVEGLACSHSKALVSALGATCALMGYNARPGGRDEALFCDGGGGYASESAPLVVYLFSSKVELMEQCSLIPVYTSIPLFKCPHSNTRELWQRVGSSIHLVLCTVEFLLNALEKHFFSLLHVVLIIIDDFHLAAHKHPISVFLNLLHSSPNGASQAPRVLGLTTMSCCTLYFESNAFHAKKINCTASMEPQHPARHSSICTCQFIIPYTQIYHPQFVSQLEKIPLPQHSSVTKATLLRVLHELGPFSVYKILQDLSTISASPESFQSASLNQTLSLSNMSPKMLSLAGAITRMCSCPRGALPYRLILVLTSSALISSLVQQNLNEVVQVSRCYTLGTLVRNHPNQRTLLPQLTDCTTIVSSVQELNTILKSDLEAFQVVFYFDTCAPAELFNEQAQTIFVLMGTEVSYSDNTFAFDAAVSPSPFCCLWSSYCSTIQPVQGGEIHSSHALCATLFCPVSHLLCNNDHRASLPIAYTDHAQSELTSAEPLAFSSTQFGTRNSDTCVSKEDLPQSNKRLACDVNTYSTVHKAPRTEVINSGRRVTLEKCPQLRVASCFQGPWKQDTPESYQGFAHSIIVDGVPLSWVIVTPSNFAPGTSTVEFPVRLKSSVAHIKVQSCGSIIIPTQFYENMLLFQEHLFRLLLPHLGTSFKWDNNTAKIYSILPICEPLLPELCNIDWRSVTNITTTIQRSQFPHMPTPTHTHLEVRFGEELIFTPYNTQLYIPLQYTSKNLLVDFGNAGSKYRTYYEYYTEKWKLVLDPEQKLLECTFFHTEKQSKDLSPAQTVLLAPEACEVYPLSFFAMKQCLKLPAIIYALERIASTVDLQVQIPSLSVVPCSLLLSALTAPSACDITNYERLEKLGDCVLKLISSIHVYCTVPGGEGKKSQERAVVVSNSNLTGLCHSSVLPFHIFTAPVTVREWVPPGFPPKDTTRLVSPKLFADVLESCCGALFLCCKDLSVSCEFLRAMGLPFRQINQYFILIDTSLSVSDEFRRVQVILHYEFRSWTLLGRALTPKSINSHLDQNYQLLEFLGDAVCDLIIVEHLFQCHPNQPPSVLSSLQRKRACNTSLSQACLHWGFDKFIRQNERPSASVCADVFEAIAGAVFVDTNFSYTRTQAVIFPLLFDYIKAPSSDTVVEDPVTELYSTVQQMYPTEIPRPFHFTQISEQEFQCEVIILGKTLGSAVSSKKKIAKKMAANAALTYLHNQQTKPIGE